MASPNIAAANSLRRRPACVACSKAKRKCSRQLPTCRRCRVQNLRCAYPVTVERVMLPQSPQSRFSAQCATAQCSTQFLGGTAPQQASSTVDIAQDDIDCSIALWFLEPCSWEADRTHIREDSHITYPDSGLGYFINSLRTWIDEWVRENRCAFVHSRLYETDIPSSLQHALAAWQVYRAASNPTAKRIALRMVADWSHNLLREQSMSECLLDVGVCGRAPGFQLVDQISYTQALLVFQVIGLFDGDVRARATSEHLLHTVSRWADTLLGSAGAAVAPPDQPATPDELPNSPRINQLRSDGTPASMWKAWILSESIRRLWIVATLTEAAFLIWKEGSAACPGSIGFTGRSGLWDASSPKTWLVGLTGNSTTKVPIFCSSLDGLLQEAKPSDVDEFAKALLAYGQGREAVEDWITLE